MRASELVQLLEYLRQAGTTNAQLTSIHHVSQTGGRTTLNQTISYFKRHDFVHGRNLEFSLRCQYVADGCRLENANLPDLLHAALIKFPMPSVELAPEAMEPLVHDTSASPGIIQNAAIETTSASQLGKLAEQFALELLNGRGYEASFLTTNYPTYDLRVKGDSTEFLVSVKAARTKDHVRLGTRASVSRLSEGSYVFAFLPGPGSEISLTNGCYRLLIIPGEIARADSLTAHDEYWLTKGTDVSYSVMVKGYDARHKDVWDKWQAFESAWHLLPSPKSMG